MTFVHLHNHTEFSYLDGVGNVKDWIARAKELGMNALAITNHGNVDGCLEWQTECDKANIQPILGTEAYIVVDPNIKKKDDKRGHLIILTKNLKGWQELCRLLTKANLDGFYKKPRVGFLDLLSADLSGMVILTGCTASFINLPGGIEILLELQAKMPGRVFLEIMPHDFPDQHSFNEKLLDLHNKLQIPLVATNDCHYINEDDWETQEVLLAINSKAKWNDPKRWKFTLKQLHLRSTREMQLAFKKHCFSASQIKEAMNNTLVIADMCKDFRIPKQEISLPSPYKSHKPDWELLDKLAWDKIKEDDLDRNYQNRYRREFELIKKKNFSKYFLIFHDIIQYCKKEGIPVGPGRGSVGGSLTAFLIGITKVDPIKWHLSFARFLNEYRDGWPDIDMDFAKKDREKVRKYIVDKYGENYTCGITTNLKLKAKAAVGAVARVFEVPEKEIRGFTKSLKSKESDKNELQSALDNTDQKWFIKKYPKVIKFALKLENQTRGSSQHAAALIVSSEDLSQGAKCVLIRKDKRIICNWTMEWAEYCGLIKLDILGLTTLSVIDEGIKSVQKIITKKFDINNIPLDDKKTFDLINSGKTAGVFQLSARPSTELCKEIEINNIEDIIASNALVRPGPYKSGMTKDFIKRKHGEKWKALHPIYEEITKYTYGLLVYQEQVMWVISKVAGMSENDADTIRKIISKSQNVKKFDKYKNQFIEGCKVHKTLSKKEAEVFWEGLLEWAGYGFNRSHSVAYSLIGYQTAWLKANYPIEFICAYLSFGDYEANNDEDARQRKELLKEVSAYGVTVMPPKVGLSDPLKWIIKGSKLYVPFIELKGIGEQQAIKCAQSKSLTKPRLEGFFGKEYATPIKEKSKADLMLEEIKAFDPDIMPNKKILLKHLSFNIIV